MKKKIFLVFIHVSLILSLFLFSLTIYLNRYFGDVSFTQILFHLSYANNLIINSDEYVIKKFIQICFYLPIIFYLLINFIIFLINKNYKIDIISLKNKIFFSSFFLVIATFYFLNNINLGSIVFNKTDIFSKFYQSPENYEFDFDNSKNLVLIYVESYENIFSNKTLFGQDLLKPFTEDFFGGIEFKSLQQTSLTNWTIASIVATQCGIPLKNVGIFSFGKDKGKHQRQVFGMNKFLPNAICLGDILKKGSYKNIFVSSPHLNFSGTGNFFRSHGYDELYGKKEFDELGIEYNGQSWGNGPNDSFLFEFSKKKINDLIDNSKFNITILTTDTHEPNGFLDPNCKLKSKNIETAVLCTTEELFKFTEYLTNNFKDKINIIIVGDHQFRFKNNKYNNIKNRTIFNRFISANKKRIYRDNLNHYDLFPSIVDFIDIKYNYNKLGFGVSGFQKVDINEYNTSSKLIEDNILNRSKFYESFWKN